MANSDFDFSNVVKAFLDGQYEDRADLITGIGVEIRQPSVIMKHLLYQVTEECLKQPGCTPAITVQIGLMYGAVIGVLLERDRMDRQKRIV